MPTFTHLVGTEYPSTFLDPSCLCRGKKDSRSGRDDPLREN
jgi:hypothetical protein